MAYPRLTFFCELETGPLKEIFADEEVIADLKQLNASVSLGLLDHSPERAAVVRKLNQAGIPVIAWQLLPIQRGYWFNMDNASLAAECYDEFWMWTGREGLQWDGVGLDIEPAIQDLQAFMKAPIRHIPGMLRKSVNYPRIRNARKIYNNLVKRIHKDGFRVDVYQFPFIVDDRKAFSTLLQRLTGILNLPADREVLMLYSSFIRPYGPGVLWSYAPHTKSFGLGSTGGGVELPGAVIPAPLSWNELSRDLRLAYSWENDIHIFSLEGCVRQDFLKKLKTFQWDQPIVEPTELARVVENWRRGIIPLLWLSVRLPVILAGSGIGLGLIALIRRLSRKDT